jgi:hypothetical protein
MLTTLRHIKCGDGKKRLKKGAAYLRDGIDVGDHGIVAVVCIGPTASLPTSRSTTIAFGNRPGRSPCPISHRRLTTDALTTRAGRCRGRRK